jgi:hypothetical protein
MDSARFARWRFGAFVCALTAVVVSCSPPAVAQPHLYWSQYHYDSPVDRFTLHRSNLDGTQPVELSRGVRPEPYLGMAVYDGKLLWGSSDTGAEVHAATLAGQSLGRWDDPLPPGVRAEALGMAYDAATGSTYRALFEAGGERNIERSDALGNTSIIPTDLFPANLALALDPLAEKLYFGGVTGGRAVIRRSNLDGSGVETVFDAPSTDSHPFDLALDPLGGEIYWTVAIPGAGRLRRANLDGTNVEDLITGIPPGVLALDVVVPEPATGVLLLCGSAIALIWRRGATSEQGR